MAILYHYTNAVGLCGIIASKSIWASDYRYLNDSSEFKYGWKILCNNIEESRSEISMRSGRAWELLNELRSESQSQGVFGLVASLSVNGDLLSQWRGYNGGRGFSLGINEEWLKRNATAQKFSLFPVVYESAKQHRSALGAVRLLVRQIDDLLGNESHLDEVVGRWWIAALKTVLSMKDANFSEEKEFRLAYISRDPEQAIRVRPTSTGVIPYKPCFFDKLSSIRSPMISDQRADLLKRNAGFEQVIVGPALADSQIEAVTVLMRNAGADVPVIKSLIPYVAS